MLQSMLQSRSLRIKLFLCAAKLIIPFGFFQNFSKVHSLPTLCDRDVTVPRREGQMSGLTVSMGNCETLRVELSRGISPYSDIFPDLLRGYSLNTWSQVELALSSKSETRLHMLSRREGFKSCLCCSNTGPCVTDTLRSQYEMIFFARSTK